ncbi:hypothetical protein L1987_05293 [Smallanthus sonchifolius]|uniref:Uncharacterized protein n=1 Tax=Smallanthus sonchifolius TaxID=185202 RepID=A0ACB9JV90_9ASTR|nr:hypothetical protein L1987_05293 [Smallanthus sonchifolius]
MSAHLASAQTLLPAHLASAQTRLPAHLASAQTLPPAHLASAQVLPPAHLASAQDLLRAHLASAHDLFNEFGNDDGGPAAKAIAPKITLKSVGSLLFICGSTNGAFLLVSVNIDEKRIPYGFCNYLHVEDTSVHGP